MSSLQLHTTHKTAAAGWLDSSSELDSTFMQLDDPDEAETGAPQRYFTISATELTQIEFAAQSLHNMFLAATERVMASPELLSKFQIPKPLWSRIKDSWYNSSRQTIAGRMDFAVGGAADIKAFEYNIDTASCLFEAGSTQGRWAEAVGLAGLDAGRGVFNKLVATWKATEIRGTLHLMHDDDPEEKYHALYMASAAEEAGLTCKLVCGVQGLHRVSDGTIHDSDGEPIRQVWKTWAWETVFDQFVDGSDTLCLADVLLAPDVNVFEPLWTAIPNNKAILPVLWQLFPNHRNLLRSEFELSEELASSAAGYVQKPIVGRCGQGVTMVDVAGDVVASLGTTKFAEKNSVFQEMRALPTVAGAGSVLVCPWIIGGEACGVVLRVDKGLITTVDSPICCLRVADDKKALMTPRLGLGRSISEPIIGQFTHTTVAPIAQLAY